MANMSYCRFQNTRLDMMDCMDALDNRETLSEDERIACVRMFTGVLEWFEAEGVISIDWDAFDEWKSEINAE